MMKSASLRATGMCVSGGNFQGVRAGKEKLEDFATHGSHSGSTLAIMKPVSFLKRQINK